MSWNMDVQYVATNYPYNTSGSFMEYFEGLTYDHVNFIFSGTSHGQDSLYPSMNTSYYKFGSSEPGSYSYYDQGHAYEVNAHGQEYYENRRPLVSSPMTPHQQTAAANSEWGGSTNANSHENAAECPRRHQTSHDYQELLELGEAVGTQSRGLSQELISLLPTSKYKRGFFSRKRSRHERCVICQMEYKRGDRRMTLPCNHIYHAGCCSRWLSINKACPICYTEVSIDTSSTTTVKK
ncbi:E3 ubiquitin-protein ligase BIG BROTHER-like isoform X2 [Punica granatum]|uniref:E3 ubiquitin-protein ligase BIG BROTHER-like isoform X2 n=1 Tax=Punica granatum TaxID=22663 RepID=A0A6P8E0J1_PUNGR|nr:E3 ubiquitin-protein ligase BIG BROTHER-like isoform X2 [Punica granatum]